MLKVYIIITALILLLVIGGCNNAPAPVTEPSYVSVFTTTDNISIALISPECYYLDEKAKYVNSEVTKYLSDNTIQIIDVVRTFYRSYPVAAKIYYRTLSASGNLTKGK